MRAHFILFVSDPQRSARFWTAALGQGPALDVPGMTEYHLDGAVLGLMPEAGIRRLLANSISAELPHAGGPVRGELYLKVSDVETCHRRALAAGARELSPPSRRDWGDLAAYSLAPDGYVLAFASPRP